MIAFKKVKTGKINNKIDKKYGNLLFKVIHLKETLYHISLLMIDYLKKNKRIVLIILVIAFIELSGYGILASLSRLLSAL